MQYRALSLLVLSATALAAPGPQNTDSSLESNPEYQEYMSSLESLASKTGDADFSVPTEEVDIPPSVLAVLATAMPASFISQLADPSAISSLDKDWKTGKTPDWYSKLPDDVKDYVSAQVNTEATATNSVEETGSSTGKGTSVGSASATATATGTSDASSSAAQTTGTQTTGSSSASGSSAAETTGSQGATSEGGAPAPTGAMAASLAGAAGILGLAIAL
ncbi:hypothetical protein P170DRAFT_421824 [Aspergillus steynii IBT 23096]|uniref:GPI anchored protein n=1 Tax=Aspergillus steynii IBT 23096 TaxID=1392250 RepID=A0A2I2GQS6_9EURO|nr:uncharacterized protein P170DRAFT_421824 [Aspergillus steynii IBT 23096]PLB55238.1 hypothetical protein P170DRAFT_421824 [Aspergillus steynii IBT 23096]